MNIENYLMKKRIQKENMEEIDTEICQKKIKKLKEYQKNYCRLKKKNSIIGILELVVAFNGNRNKHSEI